MKYTRLYTDDVGETHFQDVKVQLTGGTPSFESADTIPLAGMQFRHSSGEFDGWHNAPQRQFILVLTGGAVVTAGDGEVRRFGPGDLFFVEDITGKGHLTEVINTAEGDRWSVFFPLPD